MMGKSLEKTGLSRRGFMQWAGALSATAAVYGCSGSTGSDGGVVVPQDSLVLDKEMKTFNTAHVSHCGAGCMMKLWVKNGRLLKITGAGDIPVEQAKANRDRIGSTDIQVGVWSQSEAADDSIAPIQRRPCARGLGEVKFLYAPDRLKYPLKQTKNRGDLDGFVRISWDEALTEVCKMYNNMVTKYKPTLGYVPIYDNGGIASYFGNYISTFGSTSTGGVRDGYVACLGDYSVNDFGNPPQDLLNSGFVIQMSFDPRSNRNSLPFYAIKAKEAGIPIVDINVWHTESAAAMTTGVPAEGIPAHLTINTGMDSALWVTMAYIIYKKNMHDTTFIEKYAFGFHPVDHPTFTNGTRTRQNKAWTVNRSGITRPIGHVFKVPAGESFVEYLISLEKTWGGDASANWKTSAPEGDKNPVGSDVYKAVIAMSAKLTGIKADIIEKLAIKYANPGGGKASSIWTLYGGASRQQNGMFNVWTLIGLSTMCGHIGKRGGCPHCIRMTEGYTVNLAANSLPSAINPSGSSNAGGSGMAISKWQISDVALTGHDFRSWDEMQADNANITKLATDYGQTGLQIKMYFRGGGNTAPIQQTTNLTKNMWLLRNKDMVEHTAALEMFMAPDAAIADIVLPAASNMEDVDTISTRSHSDACLVQTGGLKPLYETKPDSLIMEELINKYGELYGDPNFVSTRWNYATYEEKNAEPRKRWEGGNIDDYKSTILPTAEIPPFDSLLEAGNIQLVVPTDKTMVNFTNTQPGSFPSETGYIQYWNPYLAERKRLVLETYGARFIPMQESYMQLMEYAEKAGSPVDGTPGTGMPGMKTKNGTQYTYSLLLSTPHMIARSHSGYDNLAIVKDIHPHYVYIHPSTAGKRGIRDLDTVYVYNDNGCCKMTCKVTVRVPLHGCIIGQGAWYRASTTETYEAFFRDGCYRNLGCDAAGGDKTQPIVKRVVPVDVGGNSNSLILGRPSSTNDPLLSGSMSMPVNGSTLVEISKVHPENI